MKKETKKLKVPVYEDVAEDWEDLQYKIGEFLYKGSDPYDLFVPEDPKGEFHILITYEYSDGELLDWDKIKDEL